MFISFPCFNGLSIVYYRDVFPLTSHSFILWNFELLVYSCRAKTLCLRDLFPPRFQEDSEEYDEEDEDEDEEDEEEADSAEAPGKYFIL